MKQISLLLFTLLVFLSCSIPPKVELNVMTFNIRYDNPKDSLNNWKYRKDNVAQVVLNKNIDILGTQEVLINQFNDLKSRLPQYNAVGVGREDGKEKGELVALFYKKEKFIEIESGNFWLSETPDKAGSKGWDAACERVTSWAILEDRDTKKQVFVMNTHLDHIGQVARKKSIDLLYQKIDQLSKGLPVILMGDFNSTPESDIIKSVTRNTPLTDSKNATPNISGTDWTFHDFGRLPEKNRSLLDYIFVSKNIEVQNYKVLDDTLNGVYVSDHKPVMITLHY